MAECAKIYVEIPMDSAVYKKAVELSEKNKDLGLTMFSSPEKVLQNCIEFGLNPHILDNIDFLSRRADSLRKSYEDARSFAEKS